MNVVDKLGGTAAPLSPPHRRRELRSTVEIGDHKLEHSETRVSKGHNEVALRFHAAIAEIVEDCRFKVE
jgi:hypothetical protein